MCMFKMLQWTQSVKLKYKTHTSHTKENNSPHSAWAYGQSMQFETTTFCLSTPIHQNCTTVSLFIKWFIFENCVLNENDITTMVTRDTDS